MANALQNEGEVKTVRAAPSRRLLSRTNILVRRIHLYAGLFLLPWVFLYGVTGAMFNHQGLFAEADIIRIEAEELTGAGLEALPTPQELAMQVVEALQEKAPEAKISLATEHGAEFNNDIILEVAASDATHAVHIDPVARSATVVVLPEPERLAPMLPEISEVRLEENPYSAARRAVPQIMSAAGIESSQPPKPRGWCKLNFLADIDGQPARVTYVLRDGHVDVTRYEGTDGMTPRQFFLRLHTSHGQPPHWNGRMMWSVLVDVMAIAMVTWGLSGLIMWWQLKRTRMIGGAVLASSVIVAVCIYFSMMHFYATTKL